MKLASGTVLGLAALVSSPALWRGLNGDLALDIALTRYLVAVVIVWAALSTLAALVGDPPRARVEEQGARSPAVDGASQAEPLL